MNRKNSSRQVLPLRVVMILGLVLLPVAVGITACRSSDSLSEISRETLSAPFIRTIPAAEFSELFGKEQDALLLDVRTMEEYRTAHIPGTLLIPVHELEIRMPELDPWKEKPVYVYCRSGNRSAMAARLLQEAGFERIFNLDGGILAWERAGLPIE